MLSAAGTMEGSMSKAGPNSHRNTDGEISAKHGNTLIRTLRKIYGQSFAAGYPETERLSEVLLKLNETSLSKLRRDHETRHLELKIAGASREGQGPPASAANLRDPWWPPLVRRPLHDPLGENVCLWNC